MDRTEVPDIAELLCKHHREDILTECKHDPVAAEVATLLVQIEQTQDEAGWNNNNPTVHIATTNTAGVELQIERAGLLTAAHINFAAQAYDGDPAAGLHALAHITEGYRVQFGSPKNGGELPIGIPPGRKFYGVAYSCEATHLSREDSIMPIPESEIECGETRIFALYTRGGNFWQLTRLRGQGPHVELLRPECDHEGRATLIPHSLSILTREFAGLGVPVC